MYLYFSVGILTGSELRFMTMDFALGNTKSWFAKKGLDRRMDNSDPIRVPFFHSGPRGTDLPN